MIVETAMRLMLRGRKESGKMTSRCFDMLAILITVCFLAANLCMLVHTVAVLCLCMKAADTLCSDKPSKAANADC